MVDVSAKSVTKREAEASAFVMLKPKVLNALPKNPKGDALEVARLAGIMAAKRTADLIPMCHPLPLSHVDVEMRVCENGVAIASKVSTTAVTGVEMEALMAASIAALTVYDMCKGLDKGIEIREIVLERKSGGRSGDYRRAQKEWRLQPRRQKELARSMANNVRLLLVDDNPMVLGLLRGALTPLAKVTTATDAADALLKAVDDPPDLLVCDYRMPGMDGRQLVEKLRSRPRTAEAAVILVATKTDISEKLSTPDLPVDDFVEKPFFLREATQRIKRVIDKIALEKMAKTVPSDGVLRGSLLQMNVIDLVQSLEMGRKSCSLTLTNKDDKCELYFKEGPGHVTPLMARSWVIRRCLRFYAGRMETSKSISKARRRSKLPG